MKTLRLLFIISLFNNGVFDDTDEIEIKKVKEGDSVTLHTDTDIQKDDVILWRFGEDLIARVNRAANKTKIYDDVLDGRFRDRLQVDDQTGSLTITNIRSEHTGDYKLHVNRDKKHQTDYKKTFKIVQGLDNKDKSEKQTDHETMDNTGQEPLSSGAVAGICIFVLSVMAAAGVIFYRRYQKMSEQTKLWVEVIEGESVTIQTGGKIQSGDQIQWISPDNITLVTGENGDSSKTEYTDDKRFRDRVKMNHQTGDLTITDIRKTDAGEYTLNISRDKRISVRRRFKVCVIAGNRENEPATVDPLVHEAEDPV